MLILFRLLLVFTLTFFSCQTEVEENVAPKIDKKTIRLKIDLFKPSTEDIKKSTLENLYIVLPDERKVYLVRDRIEERKNGFTWSGHIEGYENSSFILSVENGVAYGRIRIEKKIFEIEPVNPEEKLYKIIDLSNGKSIPMKNDFIPFQKKIENNKRVEISSIETKNFEDGNQIDLLVLYTDEFEKKYGTGVNAQIRKLVDVGNQAFQRSGIKTRINIVGILKYDTNDTNENITFEGTALKNLANSQYVRNLRKAYKADLVTLLRVYKHDGDGICGIAYLLTNMPENPSSNLSYLTEVYRDVGYSIVNVGKVYVGNRYYFCYDTTLIHEIGHNLGCSHDRNHANNPGAYSYSYGYDIPNQFATIMSYDRPLIEYFSNPNITYNGFPIGKPEGDPESADNVKTINKTRIIISNFYNKTENDFYPDISVSQDSINFGQVYINESSSKTIYISNTGNAPLHIGSISLDGSSEFSEINNCLRNEIQPGDNCYITVYFQPVSEGLKKATLTVNSDAKSNPFYIVPITGEGIYKDTPEIVVSKKVHNFGRVNINEVSSTVIKIENISKTAPLSLKIYAPLSEDFSVKSDCSDVLNPGEICSLTVLFSPKSTGSKTFVINVQSNDPKNRYISLRFYGEGYKPPRLSIIPESIDFGKVYIGRKKIKTLTIRNIGGDILYINKISVKSSDFSLNGTCNRLSPDESCKIDVEFNPSKEGIVSSYLLIESSIGEKRVLLTGEGIPKPEPKILIKSTVLDFGEVYLGNSSDRELDIFNTGNAPLHIKAYVNGNDFSIINRCDEIQPGNKCNLKIRFSPKKVGKTVGNLVISTDDPYKKEVHVYLIGKGKHVPVPDIKVNPDQLSIGKIYVGDVLEKDITIKNTGNAVLKIKGINISHNFIHVVGSCNQIEPSKTCTLKVLFKPSKTVEGNDFFIELLTNDPDELIVNIPVHVKVKEKPKPVVNFVDMLDFKDVRIGEKKEDVISIKNTGNAPLLIKDILLEDRESFYIQEDYCKEVKPGEECILPVIFEPKKAGYIKTYIKILTNIGVFTVTLKGKGLTPSRKFLSITPDSVEFGKVLAGRKKEKTVILRNTGTIQVHITDIHINSNDFYIKHTNCSVLEPEDTCNVDIIFNPKEKTSVEMPVISQLIIKTDIPGQHTYTVQLKGIITAEPLPDIYSEKTINFGKVKIGDKKDVYIPVKNTGKAQLKILDIYTDNNEFSVESKCTALDEGKECSIKVTFKPQEVGLVEGSLHIISNDPDDPDFVVHLTGEGILENMELIKVEPENIEFGQVITGFTKEKKIKITNTSSLDLPLYFSLEKGSSFSIKNSCPEFLSSGQICILTVVFSPVDDTFVTDVLNIETDFYGKERKKVLLSGRGIYIERNQIDIDNDGQISDIDVEKAAEYIIQNKEIPVLDINKDNKVDISDLILILKVLKGENNEI